VIKKGVNEFGFGGEDDQAVPEADAAMEEEKKTIMIWFSLNSLRKFHSRYLVHLEFCLKKALVWLPTGNVRLIEFFFLIYKTF